MSRSINEEIGLNGADGTDPVGEPNADMEKPAARLTGVAGRIVAVACVLLSCYALYYVLNPMQALNYRATFLAASLALVFVLYRWRPDSQQPATADQDVGRPRTRNPGLVDWCLAALALISVGYALVSPDEFMRRAVMPTGWDMLFGVLALILILEGTRRTIGWILPAICLVFIGYAYLGALLPTDSRFGHVGYDIDRIVGQLYMGLSGVFGIPLDVAATYIVLFAVYGAVLQASGAGQYFINLSFAAFGNSATAPGRTTVLAGFLLGTVSGSGVATTVTLGSFSWPVLKKSGYPKAEGGGILSASGIGAILSPPTLGAAAFIIAEFLGVSYLQVLIFATIPTLLYYLGIILAIEIDSRRFRTTGVDVEVPPLGFLLWRYGYHFSSLILIILLMVVGFSPLLAVSLSTAAAFLLSFLDKKTRITPRRAWEALAAGAMGVLPVVGVCAAAGIIMGIVSLTGVGLNISAIIVDIGGGSLLITAVLSAVAVLLLGLAVPVTASFIIAAVIIGPALTSLGVEPFAAFMFIFYYAVLSEVTPPTALTAVAAASITGANAFKTMMLTWRYTLPAFLVPFAFVLSPNGEALLMQAPALSILVAVAASAVAVAALAAATAGWIFGPASWLERLLCAVAAILMLRLETLWVSSGLATLLFAVALHSVLRHRRRMRASHSEDVTSQKPASGSLR